MFGVRNTCSRHGGIHPLIYSLPFRRSANTHNPASHFTDGSFAQLGGALLTTWWATTGIHHDPSFLASDGARQCPNHQRCHIWSSHEAILRRRKSEDISRYTFDTPDPQDAIALCTCFTCSMFPFLPTIDYRIRIVDSRLFFEHALGHAVIF